MNFWKQLITKLLLKMSYKTRGNYPVKVDICQHCHRVKYYCECKEVKMSGNLLSEKELKLLELITTLEQKVTVKVIEETLGKEYVGALGKLINSKLVEAKKDRASSDSYTGKKMIKYYVIKEESK